MDVVGGFLLADGTSAKALTGVDDHSRFCVSAMLMPKERTQAVCDALAAALRAHGVPQQILTDNGKVFTGRFGRPPVEVLFDRTLLCVSSGHCGVQGSVELAGDVALEHASYLAG